MLAQIQQDTRSIASTHKPETYRVFPERKNNICEGAPNPSVVMCSHLEIPAIQGAKQVHKITADTAVQSLQKLQSGVIGFGFHFYQNSWAIPKFTFRCPVPLNCNGP